MAYMFKELSEFPKQYHDHLTQLNESFADRTNTVPVTLEDYGFVIEDTGKNIHIIYGDLPKNFGNPAVLSNKEYLVRSYCYIKDGKIIKNRFGDQDIL